MSHLHWDFEQLFQLFEGVTRHMGRTLGRCSTVSLVLFAGGQNRDDQNVNKQTFRARTRDRAAAGIVAQSSRRSVINPTIGSQVG